VTGVSIYIVNAFCGAGADGNPAAVCILDREYPAAWMQSVAAQLNLSEVGFLEQIGAPSPKIRWFSPITEMPLCGHVTLAAAHVLFNEIGPKNECVISFSSASGPLDARRFADGVELDFPSIDCRPIATPPWLAGALGVQPGFVLASETKYLIELATEQEVRQVRPDFRRIRSEADRGLIVTARSATRDFDVVSRYFAGYVGVDEDPATGSAHCCLTSYWTKKLGFNELRMWQASPRGAPVPGSPGWCKGSTEGRGTDRDLR